MKEWKLEDLNEEYNLDFDKIVNLIQEEKAKRVLLQFPDGLKQYSKAIVDYLKEKTSAEFIIYLGTCFGACDTPLGMEDKVDLMIQLGHNSLMPNYLN